MTEQYYYICRLFCIFARKLADMAESKVEHLLDSIHFPEDLRHLSQDKLEQVCADLRQYIIDVLSENPGHLGASLGTVELTVALHYVFNTPMTVLSGMSGIKLTDIKYLQEGKIFSIRFVSLKELAASLILRKVSMTLLSPDTPQIQSLRRWVCR